MKYFMTLGALLLVWSMRGEAHSSFEAMQQGGSLLQLSIEFVHPLLEYPMAIVAVVVLLVVCYVVESALKMWLKEIFNTTE